MRYTKDTNRKIRKTEFIYIGGSKNGSSSKHRWSLRRCEPWAKGIWNQNSNTVIYEKYCSYLSISIFNDMSHVPRGAIWSRRFSGLHKSLKVERKMAPSSKRHEDFNSSQAPPQLSKTRKKGPLRDDQLNNLVSFHPFQRIIIWALKFDLHNLERETN